MGLYCKYFFITSEMNKKVLDVSGGSKAQGTSVIMYAKHGGENQQFYFEPSTRTLRSRLNDFCLDTDDSGATVLNPYTPGRPQQQWMYDKDRKLFLDAQTKALDIAESNKSDGAKVVVWGISGNPNQQWCADYVDLTFFTIRSELNDKAVDIQSSNTVPGVNVIMYSTLDASKPSDNQTWYDDKDGNIRSKLNNLVLDASGDHVVTSAFQGHARQFWLRQGNKIVCKSDPNTVLDVRDSNKDNGALLCAYQYHNTSNQHWKFQPV